MTKSDHRKPINFVGMYFIDEHGEDYRTGHSPLTVGRAPKNNSLAQRNVSGRSAVHFLTSRHHRPGCYGSTAAVRPDGPCALTARHGDRLAG